jgi:hypothetical protein
MDELAAENERLRKAIRRLADQDATLSVCDGNVTVQMDAKWIPVKEQLPEHDTNVLIAVRRKDGEVVVKEVLFVDWSLPHEPADPRFADDCGGEDLKDVSHWMPLPEPPPTE